MAWQGRYAVFFVAFFAAASCGCTSMARRPFARHGHKAQMSQQQLSFARLNERNGASDSATKAYHKVLERDPASKTANHRLGVIAAKGGKFGEAHAHFKKVTTEGKPSAALLSDIGYTFYLEDRLDEAEQALRGALKADGKYAAAHNNLGLVLGQQGRIEEAHEAFRAAGTEAQAHANMGYVHAHRLEFAEAQSHYSRALSLDNDLRPAAEAMIQIARRQPRRGDGPMAPEATETAETRLASYRPESSGASSASSSMLPTNAQASASSQPSVESDAQDAADPADAGSLLSEATPDGSSTASRLPAEKPATTNEVPLSSLKSPTRSTTAASPMRVRNRLRMKHGKSQGPRDSLSKAGVESPPGSALVASIQDKPHPRRRSILTVKRRRSEQERATDAKPAQVEQTDPSTERPEMQAGQFRPDIFSWGAQSTSSAPRMAALSAPEGMATTRTPAPNSALPSSTAAPALPLNTNATDETHVLNVHSQPRVFSWTTPVESAAPPEDVRSNSLATRVVGESTSDSALRADETDAAALVQEPRKRRRVVVVRTSKATSEAGSGGFAEASDSDSAGG